MKSNKLTFTQDRLIQFSHEWNTYIFIQFFIVYPLHSNGPLGLNEVKAPDYTNVQRKKKSRQHKLRGNTIKVKELQQALII